MVARYDNRSITYRLSSMYWQAWTGMRRRESDAFW
jgi:hypothetical protein